MISKKKLERSPWVLQRGQARDHGNRGTHDVYSSGLGPQWTLCHHHCQQLAPPARYWLQHVHLLWQVAIQGAQGQVLPTLVAPSPPELALPCPTRGDQGQPPELQEEVHRGGDHREVGAPEKRARHQAEDARRVLQDHRRMPSFFHFNLNICYCNYFIVGIGANGLENRNERQRDKHNGTSMCASSEEIPLRWPRKPQSTRRLWRRSLMSSRLLLRNRSNAYLMILSPLICYDGNVGYCCNKWVCDLSVAHYSLI